MATLRVAIFSLYKLSSIEKGGKTENNRIASPAIVLVDSNPIALRKAKIVYNFGLSECNRVNCSIFSLQVI